MKRTSRILAIVLALIMVLSCSAFALWEQYQGDDEHNGQITDGQPYITSGSLGTHLDEIQLGSGGWSGIDTEPLMLTEGSTTYAYVTYNGGAVSGNNGGTRLAKIDCSSPNSVYTEGGVYDPQKRIVWSIQLTQSATFQLSTPCYYNGRIYVAGSGLSQLLQNNELVKSESTYPHWSISGGTQNNGYVTIVGDHSATFTTTDYVEIAGGYNHRPAVGIRLGATAPDYTEATIAVSARRYGETGWISLGSFQFTPDASSSSNRPIQIDGIYYYYLNHNLSSEDNNKLTSGNYQFKYVVTISDSDSATNSVDVEYCSFYEQNSTLFEISSITGTTPPSSEAIVTLGTNGGQINTPITAYGYTVDNTEHKCIYFGTYSGTKSYYQYDLTTETLKTFSPGFTTTGFYWAGAYSDGISVAFGSDNGYLCYTTAANFGTTKVEYNLSQYSLTGITDAGNVRSSLCKYGDYVYFTSQGDTGNATSYIWKVYWPHIANLTSSDISVRQLSGGSATSTPVISSNGYIYVGTYGSTNYSNNGVRAIPLNNFTSGTILNVVSGTGSGKTGTNYAVQSSVIVYSPNTSDDYIFFTTNQSATTNAVSGRGYCYLHSVSGNSHTYTPIWDTGSSGTFALQGMSATNGYLAFGDDGHTFYVIKP